MKTNTSSFFTKKDVEQYLKNEFELHNAHILFDIKEINPKKYLEIVDTVFKKFTNHWMDKQTGELVTQDPSNPLLQFYVYGYPGYHSIENLDDLTHHMLNAHLLRAERLCELNHVIQKEQPDLEL